MIPFEDGFLLGKERSVVLDGWVCGEGYIRITWEMVSSLIHLEKEVP